MYCGIVKYEEWVFWLVKSRWIDDNEIRLAELTSASRFSRYFEQVEESLLQLLACACG
jgi:hypothetical protein